MCRSTALDRQNTASSGRSCRFLPTLPFPPTLSMIKDLRSTGSGGGEEDTETDAVRLKNGGEMKTERRPRATRLAEQAAAFRNIDHPLRRFVVHGLTEIDDVSPRRYLQRSVGPAD